MESRKESKCFLRKLFTIVALLFVPFFSVLRSINVSAVSLSTANFDLNYFTNNGSYQWRTGIPYGRSYGTSIVYGAARYYQWNTPSITAEGSYASIHFETNLVISTDDIQYVFGYWTNRQDIDITSCAVNGSYRQPVAKSISTAATDWDTTINNVQYFNSTLTVYGDVVLDNVPSGNSVVITCNQGNTSLPFYTNNSDNPDLFYFEQNPMSIEWSNNINDALMKTQINQNTTIINQSQTYYDKSYEAVDNISGQSTSDISNAENAQTTSIIGTISSFVSALGTIQTGTCSMTLPFPQFLGGDTVVNPCNGKDKAPALVSVASSMFLIGIFVPFAFIVLKMIYNEIRSFTNG